MIRNYLKTAFRSLWRNKQFTGINIVGLALGIAVFLLIAEYLAWEWSANRFNPSYENLYRVNVQYKEEKPVYCVPPGFAPVIKQEFPAIEKFVRVADGIGDGLLRYQPKGSDERALKGRTILYADSNFLEVFSFPVTAGNKILQGPKTLALSESTSRNLFGKENVKANSHGFHEYDIGCLDFFNPKCGT